MNDATVEIDPRFNGPPNSGNGGYACGLLAEVIGGTAKVALRMPPPLSAPLTRVELDGGWQLLHGDDVVAIGQRAELDPRVPEPPTLEEAAGAEPKYIGFQRHLFPGCFVCGPERAEDDGLRLFTGEVEGGGIVASTWTPLAEFADAEGNVIPRIAWSALDCPTYFGGRVDDYPSQGVLGSLTARLVEPIKAGEPHVVIGWPIEPGERKWRGGSAIFDAQGSLRAHAVGTWVVIAGRVDQFT